MVFRIVLFKLYFRCRVYKTAAQMELQLHFTPLPEEGRISTVIITSAWGTTITVHECNKEASAGDEICESLDT